MAAIVALPQVVEELLRQFGDVFPNEPARLHFAEYVTGLLVAEHKTVSGIAREFADAPDQSCLSRFLTESPWDPELLNAQRLEWRQQDPATRYRQDGVIPLDNTLIDHDGKLIEDAGWFWDHADQRHLIAHGYLFINDVNPSGTHYPLDVRRFRKKEHCDDAHPFQNHTDMAKELIDWAVSETILGDFAFDSYFANGPIMNHIQRHGRGYIGDLKFNRIITVSGEHLSVSAWTKTLRPRMRTKFTVGEHTQWCSPRSFGFRLGQTRHMHLAMLVYTALMRQVEHGRTLDWAHTRLMTIGEACRAVARETLGKTLTWAVTQAQHGMSLPDIQHPLALS